MSATFPLGMSRLKRSLTAGCPLLRELSVGRGSTDTLGGGALPKIHTVDPWDGKDGQVSGSRSAAIREGRVERGCARRFDCCQNPRTSCSVPASRIEGEETPKMAAFICDKAASAAASSANPFSSSSSSSVWPLPVFPHLHPFG